MNLGISDPSGRPPGWGLFLGTSSGGPLNKPPGESIDAGDNEMQNDDLESVEPGPAVEEEEEEAN